MDKAQRIEAMRGLAGDGVWSRVDADISEATHA
jgi:hypothetical protein